MTFDPFGDYSTRGYLRNSLGVDENTVKRLEQRAFRANVDSALKDLSSKSSLSYEDVLQTHAKLFSSIYPWAGQDRTVTAPDSAIGKNGNFDLFSHPGDSRRSVETALEMASNRNTMRSKPGEIMGYLAFGHPFLDGNGRAIMTVHAELGRRAGMHIDWSQTKKDDYLKALTQELENPGRGHLDNYLKFFVRTSTLDQAQTADQLRNLPGLGPSEAPKPGPVIIPARQLDTTVSKAEVEKAFGAADSYKDTDRKLEGMAGNVYKDPAEVIRDVRAAAIDGAIGDKSVVSRINHDPESYGPYRGKGGVFSTQAERQENRNAIAGRSGLKGVADHLITTAHGIRTNLAQEKAELAERGKVEIRLPETAMMNAIEKRRPLSEAQSAEIDKAIRSFERRFGDDIGKVRTARNLEPLAQKHGLDTQQLTMARQVLKTLDKGQSQVREQAQAVKLTQGQAKGGPTR